MNFRFRRWPLPLAAIILLVIIAVVLARPAPALSSLPDWSNATGWLNSPPLTWQQLAGKPTLVYFWSSTCGRCIDGLPFVQSWANNSGLNVVLVHAPEFEFERDPSSAVRGVQRLGIREPVALDHGRLLWSAYSANSSQDILYVVAANGSRLYSAPRADARLGDALVNLSQGRPAVFPSLPPSLTRHIYAGVSTAALGIRKDWKPFQEADYVFPYEPEAYVPYLGGRWYSGSDGVRASGRGFVLIRLPDASRLDVVMQAPGPVYVYESSRPIPTERLAEDAANPDGRTVVYPFQPRLYRVARNLQGPTEFLLDVPAGFTLYRLTLDG